MHINDQIELIRTTMDLINKLKTESMHLDITIGYHKQLSDSLQDSLDTCLGALMLIGVGVVTEEEYQNDITGGMRSSDF